MNDNLKESIRQEIARQGAVGTDPRYVEAYIETYMRLKHSTLGELAPNEFRDAVAAGIVCAAASVEIERAEALAKSFGL